MRYLKVYELFKKKKGNYLTKENQPKDTFNEYLYDAGFGDRFYVCSECDSYKLTPIPKGGMTPPEWQCDNCGEINYSPKWMPPEEYKYYIKNKFQAGDYFIYSDDNVNYFILQFLSTTLKNNKKDCYCNLQPLFKLYDYEILDDKREEIEFYGIRNLKNDLKYFSNNLEDCKNKLEQILFEKKLKKYNI